MRPLYHRILITGANGLVGQALVEHFNDDPEADVLATSRDETPAFSGLDGGYAPLDVTDKSAARRLFDDFAPTVVIHCAGMGSADACEADRDACWSVNVDATATMARLCAAHGAHLVLLSTDFVFDGDDGPYAEAARPNPVNYYGRSKLAAENAVRSAGLERWLAIRTTLVFGTGESLRRKNFATWLVESLEAGERVRVPQDQIRTPTYAPDLARGISRAVRKRKSGTYHMTGREIVSVFDFAVMLARRLDLDESLIEPTTSSELHPSSPRPLNGGLLILKAESELSFRPRSLTDAIDDFGRRLDARVDRKAA